MSLLHVYRRGHIFWWRRVHRLSGGWTLDVRLSLKTADRGEARNRGAALTAATGGVTNMLYQRILKDSAQLTEEDLRAMAKQAYDELLVELCTSQRSTPYEAPMHSASNLAFMDYYQRLTLQGGRMSFLPAEERQPVEAGWEAQRIADLRSIIQMIEDGHDTKLNRNYVERLLLRHGFAPEVRSTNMTELALYPAFRDAHIDAEVELQPQSLATAHGLLAKSQWAEAEIQDVISNALTPFDTRGDRIHLEGPALKVPASAALSLSLVMHELATNAAKYGALSNDIGRVRVSWFNSGGEARRLRLLWSEQGGPAVSALSRIGFGTKMIERGLASALNGTAEVRYQPTGLQVIVDAPALASAGNNQSDAEVKAA